MPREVPESNLDAFELGVGVLFDRVLDAVVIARLSTGRIVLWNPAAEKLFGYSTEEAIGQAIEILMPQSIAQLHHAGLERYARTGHGLIIDAGEPVEMPALRKDGEAIRIELALSELRDRHGERFAVAVIRDAMQRKQLELNGLELAQARLAHSDAEAELAARDDMLDAISATLDNSPGAAELEHLANALADFRRISGGNLTLRPRDGDLVDFVHAAADAVRKHAEGRRLLVHTPPTAPARFDAERTTQILEQALHEAVHRTANGSSLEIRLEQPTQQIAQVTIRAVGTGTLRKLGVELHLGRMLMQRQRGSLTAMQTPTGGLEVVLTFPGCPRPAWWKLRRSRPKGSASEAVSRRGKPA